MRGDPAARPQDPASQRGPQNVCVADVMRLSSGPKNRGVWARCDGVSIRLKTTSLDALRYYGVALSLVLNGSKL
jgi:hypothetical protein